VPPHPTLPQLALTNSHTNPSTTHRAPTNSEDDRHDYSGLASRESAGLALTQHIRSPDMTGERLHPAVARILDEEGPDLLDALARRLSGADLTSLLLEATRRRAARTTPADVLRQYQRDRFVAPATIDQRTLADLTNRTLTTIAERFEPVDVAPLAPFAAHAALAGVNQDNVVTTTRQTEVAADPTLSLALEAATRRRASARHDPKNSEPVHLATVDRVTRAQRFEGARSFAHFTLLGLVTAGRDTRETRFEHDALVDHVTTLTTVLDELGIGKAVVELTDFSDRRAGLVDHTLETLADRGVRATANRQREAGRGYYPTVCFKLLATVDGEPEPIDVGDGGFVDWSAKLLDNRKELLMTSAIGLERVALLTEPPAAATTTTATGDRTARKLRLRPLRLDDEAEFAAAHEIMEADDFVFGLDYEPGDPWANYVASRQRQERGENLPAGKVPDTFLVAEVGGTIVGRTSIRHELNEFLARLGGHIGYGVLPAHRRRGHATDILRQSLVVARSRGVERVLVTCDDDNVGSATVIERCGGVLDSVVDGLHGKPVRRYWID
ncbi:MAG: GNAT family N-acetyltransferase, partial [Actinomycetota bacterium]|nr:GNAT family N-acetyltransferase [Actinomycetota bacterium]